MTSYQFAAGHNNAAGLADPPEQPRVETPVTWELYVPESGTAERYGGGRVTFVYEAPTYAEYEALTTFYGVSLDGTVSQRCTISVRNTDGSTYTNYNATVTIGDPPQRQYSFYNQLVLNFTRLEAL